MNRCRVLALVGAVSLGVGGMLGVPAASGAVALPGTGAPPKAKGHPGPATAAPTAPAPGSPAPSANKGRTGTYECKTSHEKYNYHVCVPKGYSDENPAGLHVYFHGQGGGGSAPNFGQWAKHFLEPYNLIGINMQYTDGDNAKDTGGKVDAAVEAIRQTMADYKVVFGRGAVASFSGGGLPHENLFGKFGRYAAGGASPCPFNHSSLYSSNYWGDPAAAPPMTWFVSVGTKEWGMGQPTLGTSQPRKAEQLFAAALKSGVADVHFKVTKDKGHSIAEAEVAASAAEFRRSDLAFAPFLYERDYPEPALAPIVRQANALALGKAAAAVDALVASAKTDPAVKVKAETLKKRLDDRIDAVLSLARELAENDPMLCTYYGNLWTPQLGTHPKAKDLKDLLAEVRKKPGYQASLAASAAFWTKFKGMFAGPALAAGVGPFLEDVKAKAGEKSLVGTMAGELLAL